MFKYSVFASLLIIALHSCNSKQGTCILEGELENAKEKEYLYLSDIENREDLDSFLIKEGRFEYEFNLENPKQFLLHNSRMKYEARDMKQIWLEPNIVKLTGNAEFLGNLKVTGSKSHEEFSSFRIFIDSIENQIRLLQEEFARSGDPMRHVKTQALIDSLRNANHPNLNEYMRHHRDIFNTIEQNQIQSKIDSINRLVPSLIKAFLENHLESYVALSILHNECYMNSRHLNKREIETIYKAFSTELKDTEEGKEILEYINLPSVPQIGDFAIDFAQQTPNGDLVRLSDFKGSVLLVDFWASNCGPCRAKHKDIRNLYSKYHNQGFDILGVSGDNEKSSWATAISEDSLTWTNVSDLKGWNNEAFLIYDVKMIPSMLLLNTEGKIIEKSIYWDQVKEKVESFFNSSGF
jgi:peroxiredoxin